MKVKVLMSFAVPPYCGAPGDVIEIDDVIAQTLIEHKTVEKFNPGNLQIAQPEPAAEPAVEDESKPESEPEKPGAEARTSPEGLDDLFNKQQESAEPAAEPAVEPKKGKK